MNRDTGSILALFLSSHFRRHHHFPVAVHILLSIVSRLFILSHQMAVCSFVVLVLFCECPSRYIVNVINGEIAPVASILAWLKL